MHKYRPPVKVLMVELGKNKLEKMLEEYDAFIPAKNIFLAVPGFPGPEEI